MTWLAPTIAALAPTFILAGCTINASPIHTELSSQQIDAAVAKYFYRGMPGTETVRQLDRLGLPRTIESLPGRTPDRVSDRGVIARVRPPGLIGTSPWNVTTWGRLYFWFTEHDRLEQVAYTPPPGRSVVEHPDPAWNIPLEAEPEVTP